MLSPNELELKHASMLVGLVSIEAAKVGLFAGATAAARPEIEGTRYRVGGARILLKTDPERRRLRIVRATSNTIVCRLFCHRF